MLPPGAERRHQPGFGSSSGREISLQKKNEDDRYRAMRQVGLLTTIPILLAVSPIIGFFMGRLIDQKVGTEPWFSIGFLILGFVAGAQQVARVIKLANRDDTRRNTKDD